MMRTDKTVFVVDDDTEICSALHYLLESGNLKAQTFNSADKFLNHYVPELQGCLILDIRMPDMTGLELLDILNSKKITLPVIVMTGYGDIPIAVKAMKLGAVDFILKPFDAQYLFETIDFYLKTEKNHFKHDTKDHLLSPRERQIIKLIINGKLNKEIAFELKISISTVEAHRARIMRKYNAKNLADLMKKYFNIPEH